MRKVIYPGSFDPFHNGHLDIVKRVSHQVDELIIVIAINPLKKGLISFENRKKLIERIILREKLTNVQVITSEMLTVEQCEVLGVETIVRSVRSNVDYEFETNIAHVNRKLASNIETVLYIANEEFGYISSSMIRELLNFNRDITEFVPPEIVRYFEETNENL